LLTQVATWCALATILVAVPLLHVRAELELGRALLICLPGAFLLGALGQASQFLVRGGALRSTRRTATLITVLTAGLASGALFSATVCVASFLGTNDNRLPPGDAPLLLAVWGLFAHALCGAFFAARGAQAETQLAENRGLEASLRAREAELRALTARVNPHFLFNSLTSIAALTTLDARGARQMCLDLAELMRGRLGESGWVSLQDELATVRLYLSIERTRFSERLQVQEDIAPAALGVIVPALVLQPLVENAIKHGIAPAEEGGLIELRAECSGGYLRVTVQSPLAAARTGTPASGQGLRLVRGRLEALYAGRARLETARVNSSFTATLFLPAQGPQSA
jgi:hypothetical protein